MTTPTATDIATIEEIRDRFPALERRHRGYPVAYFDGPGGTQVPRSVTAAVSGRERRARRSWSARVRVARECCARIC